MTLDTINTILDIIKNQDKNPIMTKTQLLEDSIQNSIDFWKSKKEIMSFEISKGLIDLFIKDLELQLTILKS